MRTAMAMFGALIVALAMTGVAFAHWTDTLYINGTVNTGTFDAELSVGEGRDSEPDCKDVSSISGELSEDKNTITVTIRNAYPCIDYYLPIDVHCTGTVPLIIERIIIDKGNLPENTKLEIIPAMIGFPLEEGTQLHYCDVASGELHVHLDEDAQENTTYNFSVTINVVQWNYQAP
ncbi:MAG: hypothetical protein QW356_07530 [Candidatus Hadarchaeales archaeon]